MKPCELFNQCGEVEMACNPPVVSFLGDCGGGHDYNCILGSLLAECFRTSITPDLSPFHPAAPS